MGYVWNVAGPRERPHFRLWDDCFDLRDDDWEEWGTLISLGQKHWLGEA